MNFSKPGVPPEIQISSREVPLDEIAEYKTLRPGLRYCEVRFEDKGIGMASSQVKTIFDLFSRLHGRGDYEGLGMGLSQSKKIMENHHGTIVVTSETGKGTVFCVILPITRHA